MQNKTLKRFAVVGLLFTLGLASTCRASSFLLINDVPIECINSAAAKYFVPVTLIISTLLTEGGRVGHANPNKNGTYDYGPMQINSIWLKELARFGFSREQIQFDACANVEVGTWILGKAIAEGQNLWTGVGNYHSHTLQENVKYAYKVKEKHDALMMQLK